MSKRYVLTELCEILQVDKHFIVHSLREQWIAPAEPANELFDEEDLARLRLIRELQEDFGVNDEAVPIILHLLDQLYALRGTIREGLINSPR